MEMSRTMTSGFKDSAASSAWRLSFTDPTTRHEYFSAAAARASIASLSSTRRTRAGSDDVVLDGILNELGGRLHFELFHHLILVKGNRPRRQIQQCRDLFHRPSLGQKLQH